MTAKGTPTYVIMSDALAIVARSGSGYLLGWGR